MEVVLHVARFVVEKLYCLAVGRNWCGNIQGVVVAKSFGSTYTASNMSVRNGLVVDLKSAVNLTIDEKTQERLDRCKAEGNETTYNSIYYPLCRHYVDKLTKEDFKNKNIVFLSDDHLLLKYCGIRKIHYFCPSQAFLNKVIENQDNDSNKEMIRKSVNNILIDKGNKATIFNSFSELESFMRSIVGLVAKI
jgi:hypothetical protein